ncbi:unnamed protein product [Discosporangium mesarthrocarpum]
MVLSKGLAQRPFSSMGGSDRVVKEAEDNLLSLEEVKAADDLASRGRGTEAIPHLQRAVEICTGAVGEGSEITRAALRRLGKILYDARQFGEAEAVLRREAYEGDKAHPAGVSSLLLLSKAQVFQGKMEEAVASSSAAVDLCEKDDDHTPDTEALGQALRQSGVAQMLQGVGEDAETSLLRAARLGSTSIDQAKGLSVLAAYNASTGGEAAVEEALELWREACMIEPDAATGAGDGPEEGGTKESGGTAGVCVEGEQAGEGAGGAPAPTPAPAPEPTAAARLAKASVLCSAAQGELLLLRRGLDVPTARLVEALKIREELLPPGHPATVWTLALMARCRLEAGEAVTSEGLFRTALGAMEPIHRGGAKHHREEEMLSLHPSPVHPFSLAATLRSYSELLQQWEKREEEGERFLLRAEEMESRLVPKLPNGLTVHQLHLDEVY